MATHADDLLKATAEHLMLLGATIASSPVPSPRSSPLPAYGADRSAMP
ncbi:MAG: hypothetical protein ACLTSX_01605 [Collinsella sp.]